MWSSPGNRTHALMARIEQARCRYELGDEELDAHALARGEHEHIEWVARLRALFDVGRHREAAMLPERLWRIVEDPKRASVERAAAAVALGPRLDEPERARLNRIATQAASQELRIALESVAGASDDATVTVALAELEREEAVAHRRSIG
jgi:hypothetical protein